MKKFICILLSIATLCCMSISVFADSTNVSLADQNTSIMPRASLAIRSNAPKVTTSSYSTQVTLTARGTANITITLEKQTSSGWEYVDSKSWSNQSFGSSTFKEYFSITEKGSYRCVSYVYATVNGNSDSNTSTSATFIKS